MILSLKLHNICLFLSNYWVHYCESRNVLSQECLRADIFNISYLFFVSGLNDCKYQIISSHSTNSILCLILFYFNNNKRCGDRFKILENVFLTANTRLWLSSRKL